MSRSGLINLARLEAAKKQKLRADSTRLVKKSIRDIQPQCCESISTFFMNSLETTLTAPLQQSLETYTSEIVRQGAQKIVLPTDYEKDYASRHQANVQIAVQRGIQLPSILADIPPFITKDALQVQQELTDLLASEYTPQRSMELAERLRDSVERTQESYDMACIVAGAHLDAPQHPVFQTVSELVNNVHPEVQDRLRAWAEEAKKTIVQEAEGSWTTVVLGAAKAALDMTGFDYVSHKADEHSITSRSIDEPDKVITIVIDPKTAELSYDISGYQGRACESVEKKLITNLEVVFGTAIPNSSKVSRPKMEAYKKRREEKRLKSHLTRQSEEDKTETRIRE